MTSFKKDEQEGNKPHQKPTFSVLMTKENDMELEYFTKMDLGQFSKLDRPMAILAYKVLTIASKPIFSGSLDHRINMLDPKKVLPLLEMGHD
jgi:hypothetical protein